MTISPLGPRAISAYPRPAATDAPGPSPEDDKPKREPTAPRQVKATSTLERLKAIAEPVFEPLRALVFGPKPGEYQTREILHDPNPQFVTPQEAKAARARLESRRGEEAAAVQALGGRAARATSRRRRRSRACSWTGGS